MAQANLDLAESILKDRQKDLDDLKLVDAYLGIGIKETDKQIRELKELK